MRGRVWRSGRGCAGPAAASTHESCCAGAFECFSQLGASVWRDQAAAELRATGEHVRTTGRSAVADLTPQELQVSLLLADGRTTREAAAALFLSPKTIEYHLRKVYTKLGIASRDELTHVIRREGDS